MRIYNTFSGTEKEFKVAIENALDLIQRHDSLRYARLLHEIKMIVQLPAAHGAAYSRRLRVCVIDLERFKVPFDISREYGIQVLACADS